MKIVSFEDIEAQGFDISFIHSADSSDNDIIILDINSIFDYEEKKHSVCKDNFTSISIIDDPDDYDAFKNFGIDAWIKREDLSQLPNLLNDIKSKMGL
jgi:hypothetical protein